MDSNITAEGIRAMGQAGKRHEDAEQFRKEIARLEAELVEARKPELGDHQGDVTLGDLAERLHKIYEPNCTECSYTGKDWEVVEKVILPIIDRLTAENKQLRHKYDNLEICANRDAERARKHLIAKDELQAQLKVKDEALEHIVEYWNRDENQGAMSDALWHIIETAEQALKGQ